MVEYDSIVPPGQVGEITQQIKLSKIRSGTFTKSVTITSNAKNVESLRVSITGKILSDIHLSHRFIHLKPDTNGKFVGSLTLSTEKKGLQIREITFKQKKKKNTPEWQLDPEIVFKHSMTTADSVDADGYYAYSLHFSCTITPPPEISSGSFILKTNHPKRETIKLRGMINPKRETGKPKKMIDPKIKTGKLKGMNSPKKD